jgi:hypothetical protein
MTPNAYMQRLMQAQKRIVNNLDTVKGSTDDKSGTAFV